MAKLIILVTFITILITVNISYTLAEDDEKTLEGWALIYCGDCKNEEGKTAIEDFKTCVRDKCAQSKQLEELAASDKGKESVDSCKSIVIDNIKNATNQPSDEEKKSMDTCIETLYGKKDIMEKCNF